jgi:alpha-amylase
MAERFFKAVPWSYTTNIYEVNLRQYTPEGSFEAFGNQLERLRDMGVEVLWFMPITPISREKRLGILGSYYACSSYTQTNPEFGTVDDFRKLVSKAHKAGFKVIIDWVANHTGWDHEWTRSNPGFYKRNADGQWYDNHGWEDVIDLNYYDHNLRRTMMDAMKFWVRECDIDGFRCDMAHLVPLDFWREARIALAPLKPLFWLAETEDPNYFEVFDGGYAWNWMHSTEKFARNEIDLPTLLQTLRNYELRYPGEAFHMYFTSNHDENSWNGTEYEKYGDLARALAIFSFTWKGVPLIYSGQEMPNRKRLKFFEKDAIEWTGQYELHKFYQSLCRLRLKHPALQAPGKGDPEIIANGTGHSVFVYKRQVDEAVLVVVINFSDQDQKVQLPENLADYILIDIFTEIRKGISPHIELKPREAIVLSTHYLP